MDHTDKQERRYLPGQTRVDLVVYTCLAALGLLALDAGEEKLAESAMNAAQFWCDAFVPLTEEARARWADHYAELMEIAAEQEKQVGGGEMR